MAVALIALVVAVGGVAVAAIPASDGTITACYANSDFIKQLVNPIDQITSVATPAGSMRAVDSSADCSSSETALTFNQKGPQGPAGPTGPKGKRGPSGPLTATALSTPTTTLNASKSVGDEKTVLGNHPKLGGRYLVIANVGISTFGTTGGESKLTCALQKEPASDNLGQRTQSWPSGAAYSGSFPLLRVVDLKANQGVKIVCSTNFETGSVDLSPYLTTLRIGG